MAARIASSRAYASTGGINIDITAVPAEGGPRVAPEIFDVDLYVDSAVNGRIDEVNTAATSAIHAKGARAICYLDAGAWENWRPDANQYPSVVLGRRNGWPGERWVDIRRIDIPGPILAAHAQKCVQAGFESIEWDNVDSYQNRSGFPLTANDQLQFNAYLANLAHGVRLAVGLKNDVGQLSTLKPYFDFAMNEQCFQYNECNYPPPGLPDWTASGKASSTSSTAPCSAREPTRGVRIDPQEYGPSRRAVVAVPVAWDGADGQTSARAP